VRIIRLKNLPKFEYTSPMFSMSERKARIWAEGRGAKVLYWVIPMGKWIVRMDK